MSLISPFSRFHGIFWFFICLIKVLNHSYGPSQHRCQPSPLVGVFSKPLWPRPHAPYSSNPLPTIKGAPSPLFSFLQHLDTWLLDSAELTLSLHFSFFIFHPLISFSFFSYILPCANWSPVWEFSLTTRLIRMTLRFTRPYLVCCCNFLF